MVLFRQNEQTLHSSHIVDIYLGTQQVKQASVQYLDVWKVQKNMTFQVVYFLQFFKKSSFQITNSVLLIYG